MLLDALSLAAEGKGGAARGSPQTLESLCWALQGVARAAGGGADLAGRGVPLLRGLLASPALLAASQSAATATARARALLADLEGWRGVGPSLP